MEKRPFVVCEIATSLDGAITGPYFTDARAAVPKQLFGRIREGYGCELYLMGAATAARRWTDGFISELPETSAKYDREDYIVSSDIKEYYAIINARGNLAYREKYIQKNGEGKKFLPIEVMIENVSDAYIEYLRQHEISYIFAGKDTFDPELCIRKLGRLFGVKGIQINGGGLIDYTFLKAGMIDEYCQLIFPFTDGATGIAKAFDRAGNDTSDLTIFDFELLEAKALEADCVMLRYRPKNAKP